MKRAGELNAQLREGVATKADLGALEQRVTSRLTVVFLLAIGAHFAGVWWLFAGLGERVAAIEALGRAAGAG